MAGRDVRWQPRFLTSLKMGSGNLVWGYGAGSPEGVLVAPIGSIYTRDNGGVGTTLYVKESGAGNTGWVPYSSGSPAVQPTVVERDTPYEVSELIISEMLSGTFVATKTWHVVHVSISCQAPGRASTKFAFYYGQPGTPGATLMNNGGSPLSGNTIEYLGGSTSDAISATFSKTFVMTGLTIGNTVSWSIIPFIIGDALQWPSVDQPLDVAVTPNSDKVFITKFGSNSLQPVTAPQLYSGILDEGYQDQPGPSIPTGAQPLKVVCNNVLAFVANFSGLTVSTIYIPTERKLWDTAMGAGNFPYGLWLNAAGSTLYVSTYNGKLFPITTATGVLGTGVTVGAGTDQCPGVALNTAETKAYILNATQKRVEVVTLPGTLGTPITLPWTPQDIQRAPDGRLWIITKGTLGANSRICCIDPATDTKVADYALSKANANSLAIGSGGISAWIAFDGGFGGEMFIAGEFAGEQSLVHGSFSLGYNGVVYTGAVSGVAINEWDEIYWTMTDIDAVFKHPGAQVTLTPESGFFADHATVVIEP